jgi:DNA (cytosine-5)-methyltransferase 1
MGPRFLRRCAPEASGPTCSPVSPNYLWHTPRGGGEPLFGWRTRYWSFLLKLSKAQPSWTLQAEPGPGTGPFHWRNRLLSTAELARLQTLPSGYALQGSYRSAQRQIGNALPSAIGELLGLEIRRQFRGDGLRRTPTLVPAVREKCPPAQSMELLPEKYLVLRGDHPDHPGRGKGPRGRGQVNRMAPVTELPAPRPLLTEEREHEAEAS